MLQYRQYKINVKEMYGEEEPDFLRIKIAEILRVPRQDIRRLQIGRKSLDARKKPQLFWNYTVVFQCPDEKAVLQKNRKNKNLSVFTPPPDLADVIRKVRRERGRIKNDTGSKENDTGSEADRDAGRVVIVGSGPAGLMCGYFLARCGLRPVIIERGGPMQERVDKVSRFWNGGALDADTNVSFGEGGAGTFSDGKLNTGVKDKTGKKEFILDTFTAHGAPEDIRYAAKPHIGTDRLRQVIRSMREEIEELGGTYLFHHTFVGFRQEEMGDVVRDGRSHTEVPEAEKQERMPEAASRTKRERRLTGIYVRDAQGKEILMACDTCVLAIGHSARDTFGRLREEGIAMEQKPFAVGVRVEHPQQKINEIQYGAGGEMEQKPFAVGVRVEHPQQKINEIQYGAGGENLPAADYKLTGTTEDGRGVYSFCMCPGGYVVNASSEDGMTAVNGMSDRARDSGRANSAVIVTVSERDFGSADVLAGVEFQREIERRTFQAGNGKIPVQRFADFADGGRAGESGETGRYGRNGDCRDAAGQNAVGQDAVGRDAVGKDAVDSNDIGQMLPCTKGEVVSADVRSILPDYIADGIVQGMRQFGRKMAGFDDGDTWILGTETRTSSPVRIVRDQELVSESICGLYPCGEGAGYAGGIMSAAMDGLRVALRIIEGGTQQKRGKNGEKNEE